LVVILSFLLVLPCNILTAIAATSTTKIEHKKLKDDYIPGFRIKLEAEVKDKTGVLVARCYFKTKKDKNFAFVAMDYIDDNDYQATLPAPWVNSEAIDYLFVVINKQKKVTRSEIFTIKEKDTKEAATWKEYGEVKEIRLDIVQEAVEKYEILDEKYKTLKEKYEALREKMIAKYRKKLPKYQPAEVSEDLLVVKTELEKDLVQLIGFYDNVMVIEVPAAMKYGLLAEGLYTTEQIAVAGGESSIATATGAATAGTITAAAGMSTGAIIGIGLGAAAVVGAGVYAASALSKEEERINANATVQWGDYGTSATIADDGFQLWFAGRYLGVSPTGGRTGRVQVSGLEVGTNELRIRCSVAPDNAGTFAIDLGGGATFSGGGTHQEGLLRLHEIRTFNVNVPAP